MTGVRIKAVIVLVLAMAAFAGAAAWRPTVHMSDNRAKVNLETLFPMVLGNWVVDDRMPVQLVSPDTAALLNKIYNQTLSRTYVNPDGDRSPEQVQQAMTTYCETYAAILREEFPGVAVEVEMGETNGGTFIYVNGVLKGKLLELWFVATSIYQKFKQT